MKVLIVDDNAVKVAKILNCMEGVAGVARDDCDVAFTAMEARDRLSQNNYDLMILDFVMPFRAGDSPQTESTVQLLTELRDRKRLRKPVHIIGLTAYQEGVEMQAQKNWPVALARFQFAQRLVDAPTHLLHIAQCMVAVGKLVEAQESYETLAHGGLAAGAPEPFREALETGKRELADLQPRIPTLRIEVRPAPATLRNLSLSLNGRPLPPEVIGIARPINPGTYQITASAWGVAPAKPVQVTLGERDTRTVEVILGR